MFLSDAEVGIKRTPPAGPRRSRDHTGLRQPSLGSPPGSEEPPSLAEPLGLPTVDAGLLSRWRASLREERLLAQLLRLLKRTFIFASTTDEFRGCIVERAFPLEYAPGQVLFRHGQEGNWMGIVVQGRLRKALQREGLEIHIGEVGPGGVVGDLGAFGVTPIRSFTVTASEKSVVLVLSARDFEAAVVRGGCEYSLGSFADGSNMRGLMADTESFLKLRCFAGLDREFVLTLRENSEPRMGYPGQVLMKEHHFGNEMFILRAGTVRILKNDKFVVELPAGVVFGELAVLGSDRRRTATVQCSSLCLLRVIHSDVFHSILKRFPAAKRVFDHAYIARMVSVAVVNAKEEMQQYDQFYGSATPRTTQEMHALVGSMIKIEDKHNALATATPKGAKLSLALPPLTPRLSPKKKSGQGPLLSPPALSDG